MKARINIDDVGNIYSIVINEKMEVPVDNLDELNNQIKEIIKREVESDLINSPVFWKRVREEVSKSEQANTKAMDEILCVLRRYQLVPYAIAFA